MAPSAARPWLLALLLAIAALCSQPRPMAALLPSPTGRSSVTKVYPIARPLTRLQGEGKSCTSREEGTSAVIFLPDCSISEQGRSFYARLITEQTPLLSIDMRDMPNVHELNTKRYEVQWLTYMRQLGLSSNSSSSSARRVLLAHGTSSEAVLRYLETDSLLPFSAVVLIDAPDIYTAGERHGRAFLYSRITANARRIKLVALSAKALGEATGIVDSVDALGYNAGGIVTVVAPSDVSDSGILNAIRGAIACDTCK